MERINIYWRGTDKFDTSGTIVESGTRKNRRTIKVKIDEGKEGIVLEDGFLYSHPTGEYWVQYPNKEGYERFDFQPIVTFDATTFSVREQTNDEMDKEMYEAIERKMKKAVKTYVQHGNDQKARATITDSIDTVWPTVDKEMIVYRGQLNAQEIRTAPAPPRYFFSTSSDPGVSTREAFFSQEEKCCLFILHIQPGVKYFKVAYDLVPPNFFESEVLIEGNGTFYQDKEKRSIGFHQLTLGDLVNKVKNANVNTDLGLINVYIEQYQPKRINQSILTDEDLATGEHQNFLDSLKTLEASELQTKIGVFETYYFPPTRQGGRRTRRRQTRKRT